MTKRDYPQLNELATNHKDLVILGFPCNQFGLQEYGTNDEVLNCLKHVRPGNGFVPLFPIFEKVDCNGADTHAVYRFLKRQQACPDYPLIMAPSRIVWAPVDRSDLSWNFEKFIVDKHGNVVDRISPKVTPAELEPRLAELLAQ